MNYAQPSTNSSDNDSMVAAFVFMVKTKDSLSFLVQVFATAAAVVVVVVVIVCCSHWCSVVVIVSVVCCSHWCSVVVVVAIGVLLLLL